MKRQAELLKGDPHKPDFNTPEIEIELMGEEHRSKIEQELNEQAKNNTRQENTQQEVNKHIATIIQEIRITSRLRKACGNKPEIKEQLTQDYTRKEVSQTIQTLKQKAHGGDGVTGEAYKEIKTWIKPVLAILRSKIKTGKNYLQAGKKAQQKAYTKKEARFYLTTTDRYPPYTQYIKYG